MTADNPYAPVPPSPDGRKWVESPCACAIGEICPHSWDYGIEMERKNLRIKGRFQATWPESGYAKQRKLAGDGESLEDEVPA